MNKFSELEDWLIQKIEFHQKQGDEMLEIEKAAGSERYASAGQYQRVMAYKDVLANIRQPNTVGSVRGKYSHIQTSADEFAERKSQSA